MSKSKEIEPAAPEPEAALRRRRRTPVWVRLWWFVRAILLVLAAPVVMAVVAAVMLIGQEVTAPSWIVRDVEARAAEVLGGGALEFETMTFTVGEDLHPRLVLQNTVLRDADGAVLASVPRIEGGVSPRGLVQGRILVQDIRLRGAQISLRRALDGTVALAFEQGANAVGAADGFFELLEQIDSVFEEGALEALEEVRAEGLIINYVDERAGRSWVVDDGQIELDLYDDVLDLRANVALLSGRSYVTLASLSYTSPRGTRAAAVSLAITDAAAADIASQSPQLTWLGVLDAPISAFLRGSIDENGTPRTTSTSLQIGKGELRPAAQALPVPFDSAQAYLTFDPSGEELVFDLLEFNSDWGAFSGTAKAYLREYDADGWPAALLGHLQFSNLSVATEAMFAQQVTLTEGNVDIRLRLDPFTLDIGQAAVSAGGTPVHVSGQVRAGFDGWRVSLDANTDQIDVSQVIALWPPNMAPQTRGWLAQNVQSGVIDHARIALRTRTGFPNAFATTLGFTDAQVKVMPSLPPVEDARGLVSMVDGRVSVSVDAGHVTAPQGGRIDLSGSTFVIPQVGPNAPARIDLTMAGQVTAAMSLLDLAPFSVLRNSDLPPSFAEGTARITALVETPLGRGVPADARTWSATAQLRNLRSNVLVPGQTLTSSNLQVRVDPQSLVVQGPVQLAGVGGTMTFSRALGAGSAGTSRVQANVTIGPEFLTALNINLPPGMVTGAAPAQIAINLSDPATAAFRLTSDLRGAGLSLAAVGWSKPRQTAGNLTVVGSLGGVPRIDELSISAPGLQTTGRITLAAGGGLDRATFDRVRLGGWLDAPVTLRGRGAGQPVGVQISGGSLDLRRANFGAGQSGGQSGGQGGRQAGPMDISLNRLQITDRIQIDNFRGAFTSPSGLQGQFSGDVNGSAAVRGTLVPSGGRSAVRIVSTDAGSLLRATGLLRTAYGGEMDLTLVPASAAGSYDGVLDASSLRVRDAPALASLLDAISVVGLLAQMDGQGLLFSDVDAQFRLTPNQVIVTSSSATGPGLGLSMDGIFATASRTMDFQGVISPFFILNGIGSVLTRRGEGLIGFNFNLRGSVDNPQVSVNPLSALTPGMFREIFRRPPPTVGN